MFVYTHYSIRAFEVDTLIKNEYNKKNCRHTFDVGAGGEKVRCRVCKEEAHPNILPKNERKKSCGDYKG